MAASDTSSTSPIAAMLERGFDGLKGATLEERVRELADREEIRELIARYAQRVSRGKSMTDMFIDAGVFIVRLPGRPPQEARGREQLDKAFAASLGSIHNMPAVHNPVISVAGDEAIATSWIEVYLRGENGRTFLGSGYYEDRLRRESGRWKFAVRDANVLVMDEAPQGALADKEAIRELLSNYCFGIDRGSPDAVAELFVEDGIWDGPMGRCESRRALHEFMTRAGIGGGQGRVRHLTLNEVISVTGNMATARSYVVGLNAGDAPPSITFAGFYEDRLVKVEGRWLFKERLSQMT